MQINISCTTNSNSLLNRKIPSETNSHSDKTIENFRCCLHTYTHTYIQTHNFCWNWRNGAREDCAQLKKKWLKQYRYGKPTQQFTGTPLTERQPAFVVAKIQIKNNCQTQSREWKTQIRYHTHTLTAAKHWGDAICVERGCFKVKLN